MTANRREAPGIYLVALAGTSIIFLALFWVVLVALNELGVLPPPQLSNNLCMDQKLAFLRGHDIERPTILVAGSSVAWRGIDSEVVREASGGRSVPLNGAFCGLKLNQTEFTTAYLVAHYPSVRTIVVVFAPQDLTECSTTNTRLFEPQDVDNFVFRHDIEFTFYLKYFDPVILAKNALVIRSLRRGEYPLETAAMDRYGDAPIDSNASRDLTYGALPPLDPSCLASLHKLASDSRAQGRRLIVVTAPVNPAWKTRYDSSGAVIENVSSQVYGALAGTGAVFWDADRYFPMKSGDFFDAMHIRASAAKVFSRALVQATGLDNQAHRASNN
jgi:hypothetical protein